MLPTFAALARVALPADRVYDGVDLTPVLLNLSRVARRSLFHPSCDCRPGELLAGRLGSLKFIWETGGVDNTRACGGPAPRCRAHAQPLVFDLEADPAESTPLDSAEPAVRDAIAEVSSLREAARTSIATTARSTVDWSTSAAARLVNCCNPDHVACRCTD